MKSYYMFNSGEGSDCVVQVSLAKGGDVTSAATCEDCSLGHTTPMTVIQMRDHLELVHMPRGHKVWPGEEGNRGLKGVREDAEMLKLIKQLQQNKKK